MWEFNNNIIFFFKKFTCTCIEKLIPSILEPGGAIEPNNLVDGKHLRCYHIPNLHQLTCV